MWDKHPELLIDLLEKTGEKEEAKKLLYKMMKESGMKQCHIHTNTFFRPPKKCMRCKIERSIKKNGKNER